MRRGWEGRLAGGRGGGGGLGGRGARRWRGGKGRCWLCVAVEVTC